MLRRPGTCYLHSLSRKKGIWTQFRTESSVSAAIGNQTISLKTGHIARFADGAVVAESGDNAVLSTVVSKMKPTTSSVDGLPLNVDYKQSAAAVGRIPTTYLRREMQQSDADIIASRIIDRSLRPLFVDGFSFDTQVICKPLSLDETGDGVILGLNAASAALACSPVPLKDHVAAVRVGIVDGNIVVNPLFDQMKHSSMNLLVSGTSQNRLLMLEMDGKEIRPEVFEESVSKAFVEIDKILESIKLLEQQIGKPKAQFEVSNADLKVKILEQIKTLADDSLIYILMDSTHDKTSRDVAISALRKTVTAAFGDNVDTPAWLVERVFGEHVKLTIRKLIVEMNHRCDGRGLTEFRPISIDVDVYKKLHGSALFQRGQSQVLGTVTFDSPAAAFHSDSLAQLLGQQQKKMFMLHYEFPGYATNEFSTGRPFNRRELGHGTLAEKALKHVIPDDFPYCIRLACQVLESNGSTSMASACVGSLALFDAGVPLKAPVAGVAIGLVEDPENAANYRILTDILGIEDYAGEMDFKIAGTKTGLTAMQLDLKNNGLTKAQLSDTLKAARKGIDHVLGKMDAAMSQPRAEFKSTVPVIETVSLASYKRAAIFRGGGYNAKLIEVETGTKILVEDDENVLLYAPNKKKLEQAKKMIGEFGEENASLELDFGAVYKAEIVEVKENGIMIRVKSGTKPMFVPNSKLDMRKVSHASALGFKEGQHINIQYHGRDATTGVHRWARNSIQSTVAKPRQDLLKK